MAASKTLYPCYLPNVGKALTAIRQFLANISLTAKAHYNYALI
jgi:hypothetical protein